MRGSTAPFHNAWNGDTVLARLSELDAEELRRRRLLATACTAAIALHALLALLVPRPTERAPVPQLLRQPLLLAPTPRFRPPERVEAPAPPARRVPMPDPTPDELEPIVEATLPPPVLELPIDLALGAIPEPPPEQPTIYEVGGDVSAPVKLFAPDPVYPRLAVVARRSGAVIVEATIDRQGNVTGARALTGLGFGLEEAALAAIAEWRFEPALRHGEPVPVLFRLTVHFGVAN